MSETDTHPPRDRAAHAAVLVAVFSVLAAGSWFFLLEAGEQVPGHIAGSLGVIAATFMCLRTSRSPLAAAPVRAFWRLWAYSAFFLFLSTVSATVCAIRGDPGMPLYEAVPTVLSLAAAMAAFRHAPLGRRTGSDWMRVLLDGSAVAVAGALFFGYAVVDLAPDGTTMSTRWTSGLVGVLCLLGLVVFGKAAVSPAGRVDPGALGLLAGAPLIGLGAVSILLSGHRAGAVLLAILGYPLVGLSMSLAAYRQGLVLTRTTAAGTEDARPRWSIAEPVQVLAVAGTAGLVITVSTRDLDLRGRAVIVGAVLIAAIVVARQLVGLRENKEALRAVRRQQAELERLALSDSLTGLPNRTGFSLALAARLDEGLPASALLIDIDDFKMVNDTLGPTAADQLLRQIGQRLRETCGDGETAARLGGDEFAVLLPTGDPAAAEAAAARFQRAAGRPVTSANQQLLLHASVGIAVGAPGETADEVLRNADIAMYAAKESGKASWVRFEPRMRQDMTNHARLAGELHDGILNGELRLLYQPVYDLVTGYMHGAEALVRWQHPARGFVSPGEFIPVAERSGLIVPLGAWVLSEACAQMARWRDEYGDGAIEAVNVNVAVRQLRETGFVDQVAAVLSENGLTPRNLILEVTESSVVDGWQVRETLQALHDMGIHLALDDFGTGQSSLSLLRAFPVDVLKLDKSFVDGIADDGADRGRLAVAAAVAQLTEHLQLKAVAEGIETPEQADRLRHMGYRYGQGYLMARPLPADECAVLFLTPCAALPGTAERTGTRR
ncbi:putative bifunctional diguanylate cyclase/phosphodiesterase [Actinoplanes sp. GCM10030250]|uniref:putative bifunctional diguanylate cyclase/phosphodiesterase n=1 Tax=Actinoplanes sp. GCM10030250 TaxID=3273376 RepID=UPI00360D7443